MKRLAGCVVSAGLVLASAAAHAHMPALSGSALLGAGHAGYQAISDLEEPYGGLPPGPPPPYDAPPPYAPPAMSYGYEPALMPPHEVYAVLRDNGFMPLGMPRRLGHAYAIAAMDPDGEDGRLLIDGRDGRIIRFVPASWMGRGAAPDWRGPYGAQAALPPPTVVRGVPRPPAPIPHVAGPHVAAPHVTAPVSSRAVPMPAPKPAETAAVQPQPHPAAAAPPAAAATVGEARPSQPPLRPTQDMPPVQGLE